MRTDIGIDNKPFNLYFVKGRRIMYRTAIGTIDHRGPATAVAYPLEVLQTKLADDLDQWTRRLAVVRKSIAEIEAIATEEWGKDDELAAVKQQLADLDRRIKQQLDQADSQQQQAQQTGGDQPAVRFEGGPLSPRHLATRGVRPRDRRRDAQGHQRHAGLRPPERQRVAQRRVRITRRMDRRVL